MNARVGRTCRLRLFTDRKLEQEEKVLPNGRCIFFFGTVVLHLPSPAGGRRELLARDVGSGSLCVYGREADVEAQVLAHVRRLHALSCVLAVAGLASFAATHGRQRGARRGL